MSSSPPDHDLEDYIEKCVVPEIFVFPHMSSSSSSLGYEFFSESDEVFEALEGKKKVLFRVKPEVKESRAMRGIKLHPRLLLTAKSLNFDKKPPLYCSEDPSVFFNGDVRVGILIPKLGDPLNSFKFYDQTPPSYLVLFDDRNTFTEVRCSPYAFDKRICMSYCSYDLSTCALLRHFKKSNPDLVIVALVNSNPWILKLLSIYENFKWDGLSTELAKVDLDVKWVGLRRMVMGHPELLKLPGMPMTPADVQAVRDLLVDPFISKNKARIREIDFMLKHEVITKLLFLHALPHRSYLTDIMIPNMVIDKQDFI